MNSYILPLIFLETLRNSKSGNGEDKNQKDFRWSDHGTKQETTLLRGKSLKIEYPLFFFLIIIQIIFIHIKCLFLEWSLQQENIGKQYSETILILIMKPSNLIQCKSSRMEGTAV